MLFKFSFSVFNLLLSKRGLTFTTNTDFTSESATSNFSQLIPCLTLSNCCSISIHLVKKCIPIYMKNYQQYALHQKFNTTIVNCYCIIRKAYLLCLHQTRLDNSSFTLICYNSTNIPENFRKFV